MVKPRNIAYYILSVTLVIFPFMCVESHGAEPNAARSSHADVIESDINNDGNIDGWSYVNDGYIQRQEIDMNFDGKIDSVFMYENDGRVKEEILDTNYDGKMDNWRYYKAGEVIKDSIDSDYDGKIDVWFYIDRGRVFKMEEDTSGDGSPDRTVNY
ncbi:MAG: hypothetical protein JXQ30_16840 [Spirochaetes bacterium]|nr:hypothetical protein [Spirochaetota bacterium]